MVFIILFSISYGLDLAVVMLFKIKQLKKGKKLYNTEHFFVTISAFGTLGYVSATSNSNFTGNVRSSIVFIYTIMYIIFWSACFVIDNKPQSNIKNNKIDGK